MSEEELVAEAEEMSVWQQHRFMLMIGITIVIALFLVVVSLALYNSSGAAQLDLSRPGYQSIRQQATDSETFTSYPATGELDKEALNTFRTMYSEQSKRLTEVNSFGGNVMSDKSLSIDAPAVK